MAPTTGETVRASSLAAAEAAAALLTLSSLPPSSLGLVLPPYNDFFIQADLSDVMLQLQCEYGEPPLVRILFDVSARQR